jgi:hypothetical protein
MHTESRVGRCDSRSQSYRCPHRKFIRNFGGQKNTFYITTARGTDLQGERESDRRVESRTSQTNILYRLFFKPKGKLEGYLESEGISWHKDLQMSTPDFCHGLQIVHTFQTRSM